LGIGKLLRDIGYIWVGKVGTEKGLLASAADGNPENGGNRVTRGRNRTTEEGRASLVAATRHT
jgi:hypothetical protein